MANQQGFEPRGQDVTLYLTLNGRPRSAKYTAITYNPGLDMAATGYASDEIERVHGINRNPSIEIEFEARDPFFEDLCEAQAQANGPNEVRKEIKLNAHLRTHYGPGGIGLTRLQNGIFHAGQQQSGGPADKVKQRGTITFNSRPVRV